jgi:hypothetical protein
VLSAAFFSRLTGFDMEPWGIQVQEGSEHQAICAFHQELHRKTFPMLKLRPSQSAAKAKRTVACCLGRTFFREIARNFVTLGFAQRPF